MRFSSCRLNASNAHIDLQDYHLFKLLHPYDTAGYYKCLDRLFNNVGQLLKKTFYCEYSKSSTKICMNKLSTADEFDDFDQHSLQVLDPSWFE